MIKVDTKASGNGGFCFISGSPKSREAFLEEYRDSGKAVKLIRVITVLLYRDEGIFICLTTLPHAIIVI
jgi:hypothetical protein